MIDRHNAIINSENPVVVKKLEEYGITPHIFNFRHRYFWDGGIHCITLDLDREGDREDYFPERG
jgi:N-dimethylarginine dimethylaminohydrolase